MASTNKTPHLGLNSWVGTDKPRREDFVQDNVLVDAAISTHLADAVLHMTQADRTLLQEGIVMTSHVGNGEEETTLTFDFKPRAAFVFQKGKPFLECSTDGKHLIVNSAFASQSGDSAGILLEGNTLTIRQSTVNPAAGGFYLNLNKFYGQYAILLLR